MSPIVFLDGVFRIILVLETSKKRFTKTS